MKTKSSPMIIYDNHPIIKSAEFDKIFDPKEADASTGDDAAPPNIVEFSEFCRMANMSTIPITYYQCHSDQHYCHYCKTGSNNFMVKLACEIKHRKWKNYVCGICYLSFNSRKCLNSHYNSCGSRITIFGNNTTRGKGERYTKFFGQNSKKSLK